MSVYRMTIRRKISFVLFAVLVVPLGLFLGYYFAYEPLKFQWLISSVESAKTATEEREAFTLAARWGRIWELNRLRPEDLPKRAHHIRGDSVLEVEWLESSPSSPRYKQPGDLICGLSRMIRLTKKVRRCEAQLIYQVHCW